MTQLADLLEGDVGVRDRMVVDVAVQHVAQGRRRRI